MAADGTIQDTRMEPLGPGNAPKWGYIKVRDPKDSNNTFEWNEYMLYCDIDHKYNNAQPRKYIKFKEEPATLTVKGVTRDIIVAVLR